MKYQNYVTLVFVPVLRYAGVAKAFELRERPDDKLPYDPKRMRGSGGAPAELQQVPEASAPSPRTERACDRRKQIKPEPSIAPDADDTNKT